MALDKNLLLRDGTTNLTATETSASKKIEETPAEGMDVVISVPQATGTSPTLDPKIQESDDDSTWQDLVVFKQITASGEYTRHFATKFDYVRVVLTVGGTSPNFGKVLVAITKGAFKAAGQ